jgi:hypothetical protein
VCGGRKLGHMNHLICNQIHEYLSLVLIFYNQIQIFIKDVMQKTHHLLHEFHIQMITSKYDLYNNHTLIWFNANQTNGKIKTKSYLSMDSYN